MRPTILVVGATGNTGKGVVRTLSKLLPNTKFSGHRILALTRSLNGQEAQKLATLPPPVEVAKLNWVDITADWLREQNVTRAFIASHNEPDQFSEESAFHLAALRAGVEYVVRISTTAANVRPDCPAYYPRTHWAIESLLSSPEFQGLQWTSLQPNIFTQFHLYPAVEFVKEFRRTGKQAGPLRLIASEHAPIGAVDSLEVGALAAHLLVEDKPHDKAKYVVNGPEDITGQQMVAMVEREIGTKVEDVRFKDLWLIDNMVEHYQGSKSIIRSIRHAPETAWDGKCTASTTSQEVLNLAPPKVAPAEVFRNMLEG